MGGTPVAFFAGVSLMAGIVLFVFALSHGGEASIVVPMTGMYPVVTIVLSVAIFKEQITPTTGMGIIFALIAVFAIEVISLGFHSEPYPRSKCACLPFSCIHSR